MARRKTDILVLGSGIAGLTFAIKTARKFPNRDILVLTKTVEGESNTRYAQGGISAAIGPDDSTRLHEEDTLIAGAGLCDPEAVRALVEDQAARQCNLRTIRLFSYFLLRRHWE